MAVLISEYALELGIWMRSLKKGPRPLTQYSKNSSNGDIQKCDKALCTKSPAAVIYNFRK